MFQVVGGKLEDGVVIGNTFDKYGSKNPIVRRLMAGFDGSLSRLVERIAPASIHEVGCGEGYWVARWLGQGIDARGSDFSTEVIGMARSGAEGSGLDPARFAVRSIYDLQPGRDSAELIVCCEVLEHLEEPARALQVLQELRARDLIFSVPREPLWRVLNVARGKYLAQWGNTPGHLQHWSRRSIVALVSRYFSVEEVLSPLPWTMLHCRPLR